MGHREQFSTENSILSEWQKSIYGVSITKTYTDCIGNMFMSMHLGFLFTIFHTKNLGRCTIAFFFKVQDDTYCDDLITLMIFQPLISLDKTDKPYLFLFFGENKKYSRVTDLFFLRAHRRRLKVLSLFSMTEQFYKYLHWLGT